MDLGHLHAPVESHLQQPHVPVVELPDGAYAQEAYPPSAQLVQLDTGLVPHHDEDRHHHHAEHLHEPQAKRPRLFEPGTDGSAASSMGGAVAQEGVYAEQDGAVVTDTEPEGGEGPSLVVHPEETAAYVTQAHVRMPAMGGAIGRDSGDLHGVVGDSEDEDVRSMKQDVAQFEERLADLVAFKAKYGHCRVPQVWRENKRLGQWVATMRNLRKADKLPQERIRQLDELGFVWCCRTVTTTPKGEKRKTVPWNDRFEELKAFKERFGHCNVPHKWPENVKLSNWVYCQRSFHRHGKLSASKIARLEDIGFEWSKQDLIEASATVIVKKRKSSIAPTEFQDEHQGQHGAGQASNPNHQQGNVHVAEGDHEDAGEEIVFQPSEVKERKSWNERFQELVAFKQAHGHCNIPWKWKENLPLFYWVRRMKDKKRAEALSEEKIALLDELGFEWVKGQNKERERRRQQQILIEQKQKELEEERERESLQAAMSADASATSADLTQAESSLMPPYVYSFAATTYAAGADANGGLVSPAYYPVYSKITDQMQESHASSASSASNSAAYAFDHAGLGGVGAGGVELVAINAGQDGLYSHPHDADLGAALQHYMEHEAEM